MPELVKNQEPDRPAESWKYPYVAAVVDFGSNFSINVTQRDSRSVGYAINARIYINSTDETVLGFLDEFLHQHGIEPNVTNTDTSTRLEVNKRADLDLLFRLVRPYVIARHEEVEIMLKNLLPGLELGKQSSKEGFMDLIQHVDKIRKATKGASQAKYDEAYFRDEWDM
jgi:hypothetical protein